VSYYIRFYADRPLNLKGLSQAIKGVDPNYKIDGGELMQGTNILAEVELDNAGSDLFNEELGSKVNALMQMQNHAAQQIAARLQATQSIVAIRIDPNIAWDLLRPLWTVLPTLATGLTHVEGQGFYDGPQMIMQMA
jgi:hypothetical protein